MNLGRVYAIVTRAWPSSGVSGRSGTATGRRCIPMSVSPMSRPGFGLDGLHHHGVGQQTVHRRRTGTARVRMGHDRHGRVAARQRGLAGKHQRAVEMLAALDGQRDACLFAGLPCAARHLVAELRRAGFSDAAAAISLVEHPRTNSEPGCTCPWRQTKRTASRTCA